MQSSTYSFPSILNCQSKLLLHSTVQTKTPPEFRWNSAGVPLEFRWSSAVLNIFNRFIGRYTFTCFDLCAVVATLLCTKYTFNYSSTMYLLNSLQFIPHIKCIWQVYLQPLHLAIKETLPNNLESPGAFNI